MKKLVNAQVLSQFLSDYHSKRFAHERLGQAFVNEFFPPDRQDPDLFYEPNQQQAYDRIAERYVNWER